MNYKEVYVLLELLCKNLAGNENHTEIFKHVIQYISNNTTSFNSSILPYDETTLIKKITESIERNSSTRNDDVILFKNLNDKLKACQSEPHQRNKLLTFLHFLSYCNINLPPVMASNGYNLKSSSSTTASASATSISKKFDVHHNHHHHSAHTNLNAALRSVRSELFSAFNSAATTSSAGAVSNNDGGNAGRKVKQTKSFDKLFFQQEKKVISTSSSENNLRIAPLRNSSSTKFVQSDSSDSTNTPRELKLNIQQKNVTKAINTNESNDLIEDLIQNVIYSFTGIEGKYLKKDIISGGFKLNSKVRTLNIVNAGMLMRLSELGYYHDQVYSLTDVKSGKCALGLMGQGFISSLKNELTKYYGMVAMLQEQLNRQRRKDPEERICTSSESITLMKVMVWAADPLHRLQWISTIADACQEKKGGALASTIHEFLANGDPLVKSLARELLLAVCHPLIQMLSRWILEGEICDPYGEFFIECLSEVGPDRLWHDKYRVRTNMLPMFISTDFANKILVTGKNINFLREICQDKTPIREKEDLKLCFQTNSESIFSKTADTKLHSIIDTIYLNTSKKVLDIVTGPHKLLEHLHAMRRYLLLGQGDFIGILMENLKSELDKPAKELYSYDLSSIMDAAIRSTNAQYEDPEILNHLDIRLLQPYDGDTGWDIFTLQYTVRGPLATMLEPSMHNYQILFKPLWRMKHIEFLLSSKIWKDQMCNAKPLRALGNILNPIMYRLHLYTSEMIHFIHQMQYYILFEVIECSWATFLERIQNSKTLDDILHAHNEFLETIKIGAFLDLSSNDSIDMEQVYLCIKRLDVWQDKFFNICFKELNSQKEYENNIKQSELDGEYGVTNETRLERDEKYKIFEQYLMKCQQSLEQIGNEYEAAVRQVLLTLNSSNDLNLQLFGIRLDFNEYYKKRDQRLGVPLTFEHMRMSNIFYNSKNAMNSSRYNSNNNNN